MFELLILDSIQPVTILTLMNKQHGFCADRSTITCNLTFCNFTFNAYKGGAQVDTVIYANFSNDFDSINLSVLISILRSLEIGDPLLSWFSFFS